MSEPSPATERPHLRPARPDDAEAIRRIYNDAIDSPTGPFDLVPRTLAEQEAWLRARSGAYAVLVVEDGRDGEVIGFASLSPYRDRPAYATTVEDSVYVRSDHHGRGVGRLLLEALVATATRHGFHSVIAHIAGGNDASVALHRATGFELVGVEREVGRKHNRWLDVVVMQLLLAEPAPVPR
jgi:phosphinothricin acetyltransferase